MGTLGAAAAVAAGILIVLACVVLGLRYSRRSRERLQAAVSQYERILSALADRVGLRLERPEPYVHPIVGSLSAWPSVVGDVDGVDLVLGAECEGGEAPVAVHTRLQLRPPAGTQLRSGAAKLKLPRDRERLAAEAPQLAAELATLAERIDVTSAELIILARPTPGQHSGQDYCFKLALDLDELTRLVRAGVALARQLAS